MEIDRQSECDSTIRRVVDRIMTAYLKGQTLVLLTDYDGTLVPFFDHPQNARLTPQAREALEQLANLPRVRVGILSGRSIDDLRCIAGLRGVYFGGTGGIELEIEGNVVLPPEAINVRDLVLKVRDHLTTGLMEYPGVWIQEKRYGITLHYQNLATDRISLLRASVADVLQCHRGELRIIECLRGIEITPDIGLSKGTAVRSIVDHLAGQSTFVVYAGDEANDAEAIAAATELGGIGLGVGDQAPSSAEFRIADSLAYTGLLATLRQRLSETVTLSN